jgi:hypothetical protein
LIEAVRERAQRGSCAFTLVVPKAAHGLHRVVDPEDQEHDEAKAVLDHALPLLSEAAGSKVEGTIGAHEPLNAIHDAVNIHGFDEIIISTLPARVSRWLHMDLPSKLNGLGLPITTVTPSDQEANKAAADAQA